MQNYNKYRVHPAVISTALEVIGAYMQDARKEKGMDQQMLAAKMGVSVYHISRCERGRIGYSMEFLLSWCAHLGVRPYFAVDVPQAGKN